MAQLCRSHVQLWLGIPERRRPDHLPSNYSFDLAVGKTFGENFTVRLIGTNITNNRYQLDNSNTFGGSHWADPGMFSVQVKYRFHY